jgi:hypothetical protein
VDAGFVREGVSPDDGLVPLHLQARDVRDQATGGHEPLRDDAGRGMVMVVPRAQGHDDFFERAVAGTFADAVDRTLDLPAESTAGLLATASPSRCNEC